jgi:prepilin peptidase CpaA
VFGAQNKKDTNMPQSEIAALLDLLGWLFFDWRTGTVILLLIIAAVLDYRTRRIPNWLVFPGALYALVYNSLFPPYPNEGILFPLLGLGLGLLLFLPLYAVRAMGAGDVKLLAMVGAFLGAKATFAAALASMIAGGVLAIGFLLLRSRVRVMFRNLAAALHLGAIEIASGMAPSLRIDSSTSAGKIPYGVAIAIGTITYLVLHQLNLI